MVVKIKLKYADGAAFEAVNVIECTKFTIVADEEEVIVPIMLLNATI